MPETRRNPDGSTTEIAPAHCGNGHPLGPLQVLISYEPHGDDRARSWTCRECGHKTWGEPDDGRGALGLGRYARSGDREGVDQLGAGDSPSTGT